MTVIYADLADLAFAIDSVLVAVAIVNRQDKIWVIYAGAALGIVLLRFAAGWCLRLLDKYPVLDHVAYVLVGWAGVKLLFVSGHTFVQWWLRRNPGQSLGFDVPEMHPAVFWAGMVLIVVIGLYLAIVRPPKEGAESEGVELIEEIESAEESFGPGPHAE